MNRRYPYSRFLQLKSTPLGELRYWARRPSWLLRALLRRMWYAPPVWRLIGGPLHDREYAPFVAFSPDTNAPVVTDAKRMACRTRHGRATVCWNCFTAPLPHRADNVLLPDGTRDDVQQRASWWRRKGDGDKLWIIGRIEIRGDDVVFTDAPSQDLAYAPPSPESGFQLERELALHPPFVAALADDKFAVVAHGMLQNLEWVRIGAREVGLFNSVSHMVACLRNRGEDYTDYKFGSQIRLTDAERATYAQRMMEIMRSLGWRTYTADELKARMHENFRARVARRVEAWRRMDVYEARPAGTYDVIAKTPRIMDMPMFEGDDMAWLEELRGEERMAASAQFIVRLTALAATGRITAHEYQDLSGW